jgi:hypothetical protein
MGNSQAEAMPLQPKAAQQAEKFRDVWSFA